jgi:CheY-like chemotaxis protein
MPKLLVIDDNESVRKVIRFRLMDQYDIFDSSSAEEALTLALKHEPDAILLDLMMPRYSGFEVCQTLSSLSFTQHIPIIIVSGESSERYREFSRGLFAGVSLEGSTLRPDDDASADVYGRKLTAKEIILGGNVRVPKSGRHLVAVLQRHSPVNESHKESASR